MNNREYEQTSVRYPLSMGAMTKEELDAEIEKGYADMLAGQTISAQEAFAEVRSKFEREMVLAEQSIREEGTISADELETELFSSESNITREGAMQTIPIQVGSPVLSTETIAAIENARKGIGLSRSFSTIDELMEALDS